jgi:hypothetical protein
MPVSKKRKTSTKKTTFKVGGQTHSVHKHADGKEYVEHRGKPDLTFVLPGAKNNAQAKSKVKQYHSKKGGGK